jgi:hypothetical protein
MRTRLHPGVRVGTVSVLLVTVVVGLTVPLAGGHDDEDRAIASAALAPYRDFLARRGAALCEDFTLSTRIAIGYPPGQRGCESRIRALLRSRFVRTLPVLKPAHTLQVGRIRRYNQVALADLVYEPRRASFAVTLHEDGGTWRISTRPHFRRGPGCFRVTTCPAGATTTLFWLGYPANATIYRVRYGIENSLRQRRGAARG